MSRSALMLSCILLAALATIAAAGPSMLVDEVHGQPWRDDLVALWPDCQVDALTSADFALETVLASGVLAVHDTTFTFTVPAGAEMLYGRFQCPEGTFQYPFIDVRNTDDELVAKQFRGAFHRENPEAGEYTVSYSAWDPMTVPFEIGTGPDFFTAETIAEHDVVVRKHINTYMLFCGEVPEYTWREETLLRDRAIAGGGNLLLREPLLEIVLKPIIDLSSTEPMICDVTVEMPGSPTYLDPPCDVRRTAGGTELSWRDVAVAPGSITRLAYEGALQPAHHQLQVDANGDVLHLRNHASDTLREITLARRGEDGSWKLVAAGDLAPGREVTPPPPRRLTRAEALAVLRQTIAGGGLRGGLTTAQLTEFQGRYHWAERVLAAAEEDASWVALYRVATEACDRLLPLETAPAAAERSRVLWFWVAGIPAHESWSGSWPAAPDPAPRASFGREASSLTVQEYGVVQQRYPAIAGKLERDLSWFGWSFYDEAGLEDPTDNWGDPTLPLLQHPGGHPDAPDLLAEIPWIEGETTGVITAPMDERFLIGDNDAHTSDLVYPPGSLPAVVVGRDLGSGRAAALHDHAFEASSWPYNGIYLRRVLDWVARYPTSVPDRSVPLPAIASLTAHPNPFNPSTEIAFTVTEAGPVTLAVYDAAGRRVAELLRGDTAAGMRRVSWNGRDGAGRPLAAGVYLVRAAAPGGARSLKLTLVE